MINLSLKRLFKSNSNIAKGGEINSVDGAIVKGCEVTGGKIIWEVSPGGMLVQKRDHKESGDEVIITIRVSAISKWHDISIHATSSFARRTSVLSSCSKEIAPPCVHNTEQVSSRCAEITPHCAELLLSSARSNAPHGVHSVNSGQ
ncbi:unnamed protein product [Fraxinus pennsylvanica]|uniref:Uncharacterized protein n=1 Tax=Fraxinus pennsylvanica TaxID=56036 RepID=A0AAD1Z3U2_9LAMI|nr:unnamed protein product [Fraxinus pennsylvanica]